VIIPCSSASVTGGGPLGAASVGVVVADGGAIEDCGVEGGKVGAAIGVGVVGGVGTGFTAAGGAGVATDTVGIGVG
jgi:hypothetical protein